MTSLVPRLSPRPDENENGAGEPGIDLYVILQHDAFALTIK